MAESKWTAADVQLLAELQAKQEREFAPLKEAFAKAGPVMGSDYLWTFLRKNADIVVSTLTPYCTIFQAEAPAKEGIVPIVTEDGDFGVLIYGRAYSIYKGNMINVPAGTRIRRVEMREFGEVILPPALVAALQSRSAVSNPDDIFKKWASGFAWSLQANPANPIQQPDKEA